MVPPPALVGCSVMRSGPVRELAGGRDSKRIPVFFFQFRAAEFQRFFNHLKVFETFVIQVLHAGVAHVPGLFSMVVTVCVLSVSRLLCVSMPERGPVRSVRVM